MTLQRQRKIPRSRWWNCVNSLSLWHEHMVTTVTLCKHLVSEKERTFKTAFPQLHQFTFRKTEVMWGSMTFPDHTFEVYIPILLHRTCADPIYIFLGLPLSVAHKLIKPEKLLYFFSLIYSLLFKLAFAVTFFLWLVLPLYHSDANKSFQYLSSKRRNWMILFEYKKVNR